MVWDSYDVKEQLQIKKIYSLFEAEYKKNYSFPGEFHNFWECVYVEKGSIYVTADERIYEVKENGIIFHKPVEFHNFCVGPDVDTAKIVIMSFSLEGELCEYFKNKVFFLSDEQKEILDSMITYIRKRSKAFENLDGKDIRSGLYPANNSKTYLQMLTTYMYQLFLSLVDSGTVSNYLDSFEEKVFHRAVDYMNSNIGKQLLVQDISRCCGVGESILKRIFKKKSGIGVHKYLMQVKIKRAIEMINEGVSISEVADRLGFSSQGYFSLVFKRETGKTPMQIKKDGKF